MKAHTKLALILLTLGLIGIVTAKVVLNSLEEQQFFSFSDAGGSKGKVRIGMDNWIGYFPLCSPVMKKRLYQQGYLLECVEDAAVYAERMAKLDKNELDFAVATVDSYLVNGVKTQYPGILVAVLDESKGGDALVGWKDRLATLDDLRNKPETKIAFTPDSPSDHLLKAVAVHFDIGALKQRKNWPVITNGSEDALAKLKGREVDAAVLWEPDVSKALTNPDLHILLSTKQTRQLIVDVLIAGKKIIFDQPDLVALVLEEYFQTLKFYRDNPDELIDDVGKATGLDDSEIASLLKGVEWQTLNDNSRKWFGTIADQGLPEQELVETIQGSLDILLNYGTFKASPLPDNDPYRIISSRFLTQVAEKLGLGQALPQDQPTEFKPLTDQQWEGLQQVGQLQIRPVIFASGTDRLTLDDKRQLDDTAAILKHYPDFRILVRGHTSTRGDQTENLTLSQDRADAVVRYLTITHDIPPQRIKAIGYGGKQPLPRLPGESQRAYTYRLPRVELVLVTEKI